MVHFPIGLFRSSSEQSVDHDLILDMKNGAWQSLSAGIGCETLQDYSMTNSRVNYI